MKKFFYVAAIALACVACGKTEKASVVISEDGQMVTEMAVATEVLPEVLEEATEIVPAAATEVLPAAAPGPDAGGKVATEVIPAE